MLRCLLAFLFSYHIAHNDLDKQESDWIAVLVCVCAQKTAIGSLSLYVCVCAKSGDWIAMLHALQTMIRNSDWVAVYVCVRKTAIGSLCRCVCALDPNLIAMWLVHTDDSVSYICSVASSTF